MQVYTSIPSNFHASYYYRVVAPLNTMYELGLDIQPLINESDEAVPQYLKVAAMTHCDIHLAYQIAHPNMVEILTQQQQWKQMPGKSGEFKCPPCVVMDTDDDLFNVYPTNNAFRELGIRGPRGEELQPGDSVGIVTDDGPQLKWVDGKDGFDIKKNRERLDHFKRAIRLCDAVTVSTPRVAEYVRRECGDDLRIFVNYNMVRFDDYVNVELRDHPGEIRILWQGSETHYEDLYPMRHALAHVMRKYPHVKFVMWGALYPWVTNILDPNRVQHIRWVPYSQYRLRLATIGHDINIAPLKRTTFNRSRSAIKWYEASVLEKPVPTLAQRWGAYEDEISDGETGVLFDGPDDFAEKLSELIEREELRRRLASNAKDWLVDNRDAFKLAPKLYAFYKEIREEKIERTPRATEEEIKQLQADLARELAELQGEEPVEVTPDGDAVPAVE